MVRSLVLSAVSAVSALAAISALTALAACTGVPSRPDAPTSAWSVGPVWPRRALEPGVAALGHHVVVAGGFETGAREGLGITARVDAFDTAGGGWRPLPDAPVAWTHINLASVGGTLFLLGGLDAGRTARGEAFALGPVDRGWRAIEPMDPADARGASGVATAPGRIYLLGGTSSTGPLATCLEYDIPAGEWRRLPDLPAPRSQPAAMRAADGTLIVAGGLESLDASAPRGEVWALPPGVTARAWQVRRPIPAEARGGCAYGVVLGELVCAGGKAGSSAERVVHSYDPYFDEWTAREDMPAPRAGAPGAAVGTRLFVVGGADTLALEPTDTLYIYAPLDTLRPSE